MLRLDRYDYLELIERLLRSEGVEKADNVFVVDEFHELELAISSLRVRHVLKGTRQFFDGAILTSHSVVSSAHNPLGYGRKIGNNMTVP